MLNLNSLDLDAEATELPDRLKTNFGESAEQAGAETAAAGPLV